MMSKITQIMFRNRVYAKDIEHFLLTFAYGILIFLSSLSEFFQDVTYAKNAI